MVPSKRAQQRARALARERLPTRLYRAAEFSDDRLLQNPRFVACSLTGTLTTKQGDGLWDRVRTRTQVRHGEGRPRQRGDWIDLYAYYVMTAEPRLSKFYETSIEDASKIAGCERPPGYSTVHLRFAELEDEDFVRAVEDAADELIRKASETFPQIGENVWIDGTAFHSRARLHPLDEDVPPRVVPARRPTLEPATDSFLKDWHLQETSEPDASTTTTDETRVAPPQGSRFPNVVMVAGVPYGCLDPTAGVRVYRAPGGKVMRFWIGGLDLACVDVFTGLTVANVVVRANQQEHKAFFPLMRRTRDSLGHYPVALIADRGFSKNSIYRWSARRRIEAVIAFRRPHKAVVDEQDLRTEAHDEHLPRCRHCGGPGTTVGPRLGIQLREGKPRLYFCCLLQLTSRCSAVQSLDPLSQGNGIRCLTALSPVTERWHALRRLASPLERTHRHGRERYGKSGADQTGKLKRFRIPAQRLRSAMSRFLDWYRFCLRHGIIGDHLRLNDFQLLFIRGDRGLAKLQHLRQVRGLDLPYGQRALEAGFASTAELPTPVRTDVGPRGSPLSNLSLRNH